VDIRFPRVVGPGKAPSGLVHTLLSPAATFFKDSAMIKCRLLLLALLVVVLTLGCQGRRTVGRLSGTVTYQGKPVKGGTIAFFVKDNGVYPTFINPDGTYAVVDLPTGEATVTVETESLNPKRKAAPPPRGAAQPQMAKTGVRDSNKGGMASPLPPDVAGSSAPSGEYVKIPARYANQDTSQLTVTIVGGSQQTQDFDLKE
jgi:hypothetical protein